MARVLILGAGFGGITAARELRRLRPDDEVVLVDRRSDYLMGLAKLWALDGRRPLSAGRRKLAGLATQGIQVLKGEIERIDKAAKSVRVAGRDVAYDYLLVALGAETAPPLLDGFVGAPQAFDLYSEAGAEAAYTALKAVKRGKVLVAVAAMPFKCPPAPYEASMLVDALLRRQGVRLDVRLTLTTPEPHPLPVAPRAAGEQLLPILQEQRIEYVPNEKPERVRADRREVEYASGSTRTYDVLLVVPPHRAPAVVAAAGLSDASGWIPIDRRMKTQHGGIYACGDVAFLKLENGKPLPKAGVLAEGQARVAAQAIAAELAASGSTGVAAFDGEGECFIETGGGSAIEVRGSFFAKPDPRFVFGQAGPEALAAKERFEASRLQEWFGS